MRTIDLDSVRKERGSFTFGGKTYKVLEPTIGDLILHSYESDKATEEIKKFISKGGILSSEGVLKQNEWFIKEVSILAPNLPEELIQKMTYDQRVAVVRMIFGIEDAAEKKTESRQVKKSKSRKG